MQAQSMGVIDLQLIGGGKNRSNSLSKLSCGPLESSRTLNHVYGQSTALDEFVTVVETKFAKKKNTESILAYHSTTLSRDHQTLSHINPDVALELDYRLQMYATVESNDKNWAHTTSTRVRQCITKSGYGNDLATLQLSDNPPSIPAVSTKQGLGYHPWGTSNYNGAFVCGQPIIPPVEQNHRAFTGRAVYNHEANIDRITAHNTQLNSNDDMANDTELLIHWNMQWVFNARSVDNGTQLRELEAYQQQLQTAINQRPRTTLKRSVDMEHHHSIHRQNRQRAEEQRHPSFQYFGSISSSCQNNSVRQPLPQLEQPLSKHVCLVEPTLRPTHYYHPGSRSTSGNGTTGGSRTNRPKSKSGNYRRRQNHLQNMQLFN